MKIGLFCPYDLFSPGGVREHVLALYQEFKKKGHQVKIMAPKTKPSQNPDFFLLGLSASFPSTTGSWGRVSASFEDRDLKKYLQKEKFDVLHFHEPLAPFLSWQILLASQTVNVATFHSSWEEKKSLTNTFEFLIKPLADVFKDKLDGLIAVSPACKQSWQKFLQKEMTLIPNGIDLSRFHPKNKPIKKFTDGKINLLFVGRLERRKGLIYLLRALAKLKKKEIRLVVVGIGPRRIEAEVFVRSQGLQNIEFVGRASDADLPNYYASADICCFPSIGGESFGIVLLEAMASGKPIICFANPGYQEVLKDYPFKEGLVKSEDVESLGKALGILIQDTKLQKKLSTWGLKEAKKYAWSQVANQVLSFYKKFTS